MEVKVSVIIGWIVIICSYISIIILSQKQEDRNYGELRLLESNLRRVLGGEREIGQF